MQEWFLQNQKRIASIGGMAALAAAVVIGGYAFVTNRQNRASSAFALALAAYHAPVVANAPTNNSSLLFYKTDSEKFQDAAKKFYDVASRYSWSSPGRFARYYAALCQRDVGNAAEAEKELKSLVGGRDAELASLAKMALAGIYVQAGRNDEAEKLFREIEDHPTNLVPKATAALARAELYSKTKPTEAKALYQQIQKDNPAMAAGDEASKQIENQAR